jgi:hypothetical protein
LTWWENVQRLLGKYTPNEEHVIQENIYFKETDAKTSIIATISTAK